MAVYVLSATAAGAAAGGLLGLAGGMLSADARVGAASGLALAGVALGVAGIFGRWTRPWQLDRETPRQWVDEGGIRWAARNGAALGAGAGSRLGFMLWFAVPLGALLLGSPALGALVYGTYAFTRSGAVHMVIVLARRRGSFDPVRQWMLDHRVEATTLTSMQLVLLSAALALAVGGVG